MFQDWQALVKITGYHGTTWYTESSVLRSYTMRELRNQHVSIG